MRRLTPTANTYLGVSVEFFIVGTFLKFFGKFFVVYFAVWVLLLPFIEEQRIMLAFETCHSELTLEDRRRNALGHPQMFLHRQHKMAAHLLTSGMRVVPGPEEDVDVRACLHLEVARLGEQVGDVDTKIGSHGTHTSHSHSHEKHLTHFGHDFGDGICGELYSSNPFWFCPLDGSVEAPKRPLGVLRDISLNQVLCLSFQFPPEQPYKSILLPDLVPPPRLLGQFDLMPRRPPRLNKARFNLLEFSTRNKSGNFNGDYQHRQSNMSVPHVSGYAYELGVEASQRMLMHGIGQSGQQYNPYLAHNPCYNNNNQFQNNDFNGRNQGYSAQSHQGNYQSNYRGRDDGRSRNSSAPWQQQQQPSQQQYSQNYDNRNSNSSFSGNRDFGHSSQFVQQQSQYQQQPPHLHSSFQQSYPRSGSGHSFSNPSNLQTQSWPAHQPPVPSMQSMREQLAETLRQQQQHSNRR